MKSIYEPCFDDCETTSCMRSLESEFWINEVPFLGHVISPKGIVVDPCKVKNVFDWKPHTSVTQV
jgi:hypothetical protein